MNPDTTTPRTDDVCIELPATNFDCNCWIQVIAIADFARQLEGELAQAKAEVERLQAALDQMTRDAMTTAKDRDEWMTRAMVAYGKEGK